MNLPPLLRHWVKGNFKQLLGQMEKTRNVYNKESKQKAVELSNVRGNDMEIARELGIGADLSMAQRDE